MTSFLATLAVAMTVVVYSGAQAPAPVSSHRGLSFSLPPRWTSSIQQGHLIAVPAAPSSDGPVVVGFFGAEKLTGSFDDWFRAKLASDLGTTQRVVQAAAATRSKSGALDVLSTGRTVQDQRDGSARTFLQIYYGVSDGRQAGLAMVTTGSEAALKLHMPQVQAIFQSMRFEASPPQPAPGAAGGPAGATKANLTMADVAGQWGHSSSSYTDYVNSSGSRTGSSTIAWGAGYTLKPDGTFEYIFTGMVDSRYIKETDTGTWGFERGNLVIRSKTRPAKEFYILAYQTAPDGVVFMTVLNVYYPRTKENIDMWAEKWVKRK